MDFFQFLNKSTAVSGGEKQNEIKNNRNVNCEIVRNWFKQGDMIKVIGKPKNGVIERQIDVVNASVYKGYIGEVKEFKKGHDYATVLLHAMNTMKPIRIKTEYLQRIN